VALGQLADEVAIFDAAHDAAHRRRREDDQVQLARAARHFHCDLPALCRNDADAAHGTLVRYVDRDLPVLLCIDDWAHWITVVHRKQERFVVLDSRSDPVLNVIPWPRLRRRWADVTQLAAPGGDGSDGPAFFLHPVKPRYRVPIRAQFSLARARYLRRPANADLAKQWDAYLGDLLAICRPRAGRAGSMLSVAEFLRRHQDLLVSRVGYWHGGIERDAILRILRNFRFVAETYGLGIPASGARRALVDLAVLLGFWSAASGGVSPMYGSDSLGARKFGRGRRRARR
jgi:hypothetical protein